MVFTRRAVILKGSREQHSQHNSHTDLTFKTIPEPNTDYNNTELFDSELSDEELEGMSGGNPVPISRFPFWA